MRVSLKKWAENEFKSDSQLNLIPSLYQKLKAEGLDFTDSSSQPTKTQAPLSKDPNVVSSQQEEDDIAKAIELSLKEKGDSSKVQPPSTAYVCTFLPNLHIKKKKNEKKMNFSLIFFSIFSSRRCIRA